MLGIAAADADDRTRVALFAPADHRPVLLIRHSGNGAGVDNIGVGLPLEGDQGVATPGHHLFQGLGLVLVDLAAEGMTMVVVTHEMGFARSAADSVVFMDEGKVIESGPPEQIFASAETDRLRRFLDQVL